jgi:hypothetical protein
MINKDDQFRILRIINSNPIIAQRDLSLKLNISLGKINYCLKALNENA